jgi:prepilin-type N-terminal cleavage/methylation domain-containing protein
MLGGNKGFTLVELLVVAGLFGGLMTLVTGIFIASLNVERNILMTKKVLGEISYSAEYMTRALRMAEKDHTGLCINAGNTYELTGRRGLKFINSLQDYDCQEFFLENDQIKTDIEGVTSDLTSGGITVSNLDFYISGASGSDSSQPFTTFYIESFTNKSSIIKVQTSVSQRNPDIR